MLFEGLRKIKWTDKNIELFWEDCNNLSQLYQMSNIDGGKTGYYIESPLSAKTVKVGVLVDFELQI